MAPLRTVSYEQKGLSTCGPASLKIVFQYFGRTVSEKRLARLAGTSPRTGTTGEQLVTAARALGFHAEIKDGARFTDIERLLREGVPPIVDWFAPSGSVRTEAGSMPDGHYSVVVALDRKRITLEDPGVGRRRVLSRREFERVWFDFDEPFLTNPNKIIIRRLIIVRPK